MNITDNFKSQSIDISNVCYFYQNNNNVVFVMISSLNQITFTFDDYYLARVLTDSILNSFYFRLAVLPATNGISYFINVENIKTFSISGGSNILINFISKSITIVCRSAQIASIHYAYLFDIYNSYFYLRGFSGTVIYANAGLNSIQTAIDSAVSGNLIYVRKGVHTGLIVLKDGVNIYFEKGSILFYDVYQSFGMGLVQSNSTDICKLFGNVDIYAKNNLTVFSSRGDGSDLYFQVQDIYTDSTSMDYYTSNIFSTDNIRFKARNIIRKPTGLSGYSFWDYDLFGSAVIDFDIVNIDCFKTAFSFGVSDLPQNYIFRNAYIKSVSQSCFEHSTDVEIIDFDFVRIKNYSFLPGSSANSIFFGSFGGSPLHNTNIYECMFETNGNAIYSEYPLTVTKYGNSYSKIDVNANITLSGTGSLIIDSDIKVNPS